MSLESLFKNKNHHQKIKIWKNFLLNLRVVASKNNLPTIETKENTIPVIRSFIKKLPLK